VIGYHFLHTAIDDHSRLAYTEILADERKETASEFWIPQRGFVVCSVQTDGAVHFGTSPDDILRECSWRRSWSSSFSWWLER